MPFNIGVENISPTSRSPKSPAARRWHVDETTSPLSTRSPALVNSTTAVERNISRSPSPTKVRLDSSASELFRRSSTSHFQTLARSSSPDKKDPTQLYIPGVDEADEIVTGYGRLRLQKNETNVSRNWMDKQRKNLQAYEYLCHIGEAKEWVEACIDEKIPPIVELEESLRDGVILAKLTRRFSPHLVKRIYQSSRLEFRHTQNINYFFQFLDEVGIPELFTFELTDLYDKKNIPKVIYCIHALGYILAGEGLAPPIGDLVGQYNFTEEELRNTQRGLDAAGISLPNFKSMNKHFEAETQITQKELDDIELNKNEEKIIELQAACRGALFRYTFSSDQYLLEKTSDITVRLQAQVRGYLFRKSLRYTKDCLEYLAAPEIIRCQSLARGYLIRSGLSNQEKKKARIEPVLIQIQATVRGLKARKDMENLLKKLQRHEKSVIRLQSISRGKSSRKTQQIALNEFHDSESWISSFQATARGKLMRCKHTALKKIISETNDNITDFQCFARGFLIRKKLAEKLTALDDEEPEITSIQSAIRAATVRKDIGGMLDTLELAEPAFVHIQSVFRGILVRFACTTLLDDLEEQNDSIIELQSVVRGHLVRKKFSDRMSYFKANMDSVIKIQSYVRAKKQGDAYKSLVTGKNPPLSTVKSFVHLLNDSDLDFEQEVDLENTRKKVVDKVHNNEMLEQFIQQLDVKIALLLKNKITLDEVIRHTKKGFGSHTDIRSNDDSFNLKALNKTSRKRLELYQGFFYILQTQPVYFSRLFTHLHEQGISDKETKDIERLIMTLYHYGQKPREEFFLLQLIDQCIKDDMTAAENIRLFLRGNSLWWKIVGAINRSSRERKPLKNFIGRSVAFISEQIDIDLESDPLAIYRSLINAEEVATGRRSERDLNAPVEIAIQDPETRSKFVQNLQKLREYSSEVLADVHGNVDMIPYHIRYLARQMYRHAKARFESTASTDHAKKSLEDQVLSIPGHFIFHNYVNQAILAADNYGIVQTALSPVQTKNLNEVTKIISQVALLKPFSKQDVFLQPLNDYIKMNISSMRTFLYRAMDIPEIEDQFGTSRFHDLTSHQRPTLYIKSSDIFSLQSLIAQELSYIAFEKDDPLRTVIKELGALPNDASEILNIARFSEIKMDLNPGYCKIESEEAEINLLYVTTKRLMIYVLRVQSGSTLLDILVSPVSPEHEDKYKAILKEEKMEKRKRGQDKYDDYHESSLGDLSKLTYRELKLLTLEKVIELESYGKISRNNNYQEILNSIANDIRTKGDRRVSRQKEMQNLQQTLDGLIEKEKHLQQQQKTYNDYIEQVMNTLQAKKNKKKSLIMPFTKQYFHMRGLQKNGRVPEFGSYKYTAASLYDKSILVELQGYTDRQLSQVTFTFSSDQIGVFNIEAAYGSIALPGASVDLTLDELLSEQYNNKQYMNLYDGMVKFNTNLLLHFIFKKFYSDKQ